MMTIGDREGLIFLSYPHTNNGFFFLLTTYYLIYIGKTWKRFPEIPEYAEMRHGDVILTLQCRYGSTCGQRAAVCFLSFLRAGTEVKTTEILIWCE